MEQANYQAYLESIYPASTWKLDRLSGGLVNSTWRATKTSGKADHDSLILKHARPYIEVAGPEWAFSTDRQVVEATVLNLWDESGLLHETRKRLPPWHSPRCLRHDHGSESALKLTSSDQEASVILLNDLGHLVNVVEFLKACADRPGLVSEDQIANIGRTVGQLFATIHSQETADKIKTQPGIAKTLTHSLTKKLVLNVAVEPIRERLSRPPNAEQLYARVLKDYQDSEYNYRQCLVLGDFTHASILLQPPGLGSDLTPVLVDWEFAQINGRGVNGDMAQFLANIHLELLGATENTTLYQLLSRFMSELCAAYRDSANLVYKKESGDMNVQLMRSAFILHGREMLNQAHELHDNHPRFKNMACIGAWYIERAGDNINDFLDNDNWEEVQKEDALVIQSMFKAI
ncbi:4-hydroxytryptamine kinase-like protein [Cladobotryum mycophilum]|uniref:4-hydroxytryptamine kinase-like protein n=1 Tax=Cladobotryum mycophilum TaxID=491253 RepID=A0ABR0T420_9HYPO